MACLISPSSAPPPHHHTTGTMATPTPASKSPTTHRASWTNHHHDHHHEGASHTLHHRCAHFTIAQISERGGCKYSINLNLDVTPAAPLTPFHPRMSTRRNCMFLNINTREAGNRRDSALQCFFSHPPHPHLPPSTFLKPHHTYPSCRHRRPCWPWCRSASDKASCSS